MPKYGQCQIFVIIIFILQICWGFKYMYQQLLFQQLETSVLTMVTETSDNLNGPDEDILVKNVDPSIINRGSFNEDA